MARPSTATVLAHTESGIPYAVLLDPYKARGARDANMEVLDVLVAWGDASGFIREAVGYTEWDGSSATLTRHLPLQCLWRPSLYCESYDLVDCGMYQTRDTTYDPFLDGWPEQDWIIYRLTFTRPRYWLFPDSVLSTSYGNREQERYTSLVRGYRPKERRAPSFAFETVEASPQVVDEVGFYPDYTIDYVCGWYQIPAAAVPENAIRTQLLTVNDATITIRGRTFTAGQLLFRGPQQDVELYQGASNDFFEDLFYVFSFRQNTWNKYRKNNGTYVPLRVKGVTPDTPPYFGSNFQNLFTPGA